MIASAAEQATRASAERVGIGQWLSGLILREGKVRNYNLSGSLSFPSCCHEAFHGNSTLLQVLGRKSGSVCSKVYYVGMMECLGSSIEMCKVTEALLELNHGCNLNFRRRHWQQRKRMQRSFSQRRTAAMRSTISCLIPWPVLEPASAMHDGQGAQQPF